jgi:hypothetical protein
MDLLDEKLIAPCGLYCGECLGFQDRGCGGCLSRKGFCLKYSKICNIYDCCVTKRKQRLCNECKDFPCKKLNKFFNTAEWHAEVVNNLKQIPEIGIEKFLNNEVKRVTNLINCAKKHGIKHCSLCKDWPCKRLGRPALVPE